MTPWTTGPWRYMRPCRLHSEIPFETMTGRTAFRWSPSWVFRFFLSPKVNAKRCIHSSRLHMITTLNTRIRYMWLMSKVQVVLGEERGQEFSGSSTLTRRFFLAATNAPWASVHHSLSCPVTFLLTMSYNGANRSGSHIEIWRKLRSTFTYTVNETTKLAKIF